MSTTVKYKGATLATVTNQTKTLLTSGTWLEDDIELTDVTASTPGSVVVDDLSVNDDAPFTFNSSTGVISSNKLTTKQLTATVTPGYVSSATPGELQVYLHKTQNLTTKAAATITPGTSDQTIASGTYLTGVQTIKGDANLVAENIKDGTSIFGVLGTYSGGGGGSGPGTLLNTTSLGTINSNATSATSVTSFSVSGINTYDMLIVDCSVDTETNNRHTSTVSVILLTGSNNASTTKNGVTVCTAKWNSRKSSSGTHLTYQGTTSYGIYVNSANVSSGSVTLQIYRRYNGTNTGTINGTYTARVYGINLLDLIGG